MSRQKTKKFADNARRMNIVEPGKPQYLNLKGKWNEEFFQNENPITLELACGRGEYTVGLSRLFPQENFLGVDLKGDRIWKGSGIAEEEELHNAGFLRIHIQNLEEHIGHNEISGIWIMFPDPRPKDRDERRRLTCPRFLEIYKNLLKPGSWVRLKTDNTGFYQYTKEVLAGRSDIRDLQFTEDLYNSEMRADCHDIITRYEEMFHSEENNIKYLKFRFAD